jgi:transcriptional regulator with GAF, ATPase, and Fis domain
MISDKTILSLVKKHTKGSNFDIVSFKNEFEEKMLRLSYKKSNGVKADAAKMLGLKRTTFSHKCKKLAPDLMVNP